MASSIKMMTLISLWRDLQASDSCHNLDHNVGPKKGKIKENMGPHDQDDRNRDREAFIFPIFSSFINLGNQPTVL